MMKEIDRLYMERPTSGSRTIKSMLEARGVRVARSRVVRLMRLMGLRAIYPKRRTSSPGEGHKIYPYLLRGTEVTGPREVYAADITYIPMAKGFLYLVAVIDWHSRKVLAHRLSNTLDAAFCVEATEEAIVRYGTPEVFNTDQGAQFTSKAFTGALKAHGVRISMDGKGRWLDIVILYWGFFLAIGDFKGFEQYMPCVYVCNVIPRFVWASFFLTYPLGGLSCAILFYALF